MMCEAFKPQDLIALLKYTHGSRLNSFTNWFSVKKALRINQPKACSYNLNPFYTEHGIYLFENMKSGHSQIVLSE